MTEPFLRPSRLFATVSVLVIVGSLLLVSTILAGMVESQPIEWIIGMFGASLFTAIAVQQYRGTFRCVLSAAIASSVLLYFLGGFVLFVFVMMTAEGIDGAAPFRRMAPIIVPMFLVASFSIAAGRMNALWCRNLRSAMRALATLPTNRGFSLRELLALVGVMAIMTGFTTQLVRPPSAPCAEHVESSAVPFGLPAGATDVSYCKGFRGTIAFEFTVEEPAFRDWVESGIGSIESRAAGIPLREIVTPFTIWRYNVYSSELSGPKSISVTHGLYYSWSKEDRGVDAAYDRRTKRAYYRANFH